MDGFFLADATFLQGVSGYRWRIAAIGSSLRHFCRPDVVEITPLAMGGAAAGGSTVAIDANVVNDAIIVFDVIVFIVI